MTTPTGTISLQNVATELSVNANGLSLNQQNVRRLAGVTGNDARVTLQNLQNKTWVQNLVGIQSTAECYSAQSGFSIDRYGAAGDIILTMGVWPSDPPNCQTIPWQYLQFGGAVNAASYPRFTDVFQLNLNTLAVGQSTTVRASNFPYTNVAWTYNITRTSVNSIAIAIWNQGIGTGDTGTQISVNNWYNTFVSTFGGETLNLTWPSLGY